MSYAASIFKWLHWKSWIQWIGALAGFSMMLQIGIMAGWLSPNIVRFTSADAEIPLTNDEISWLVSTSFLTCVIGGILGLISMECIGVRYTAIVGFLASSISWISFIAANSIEWIFAGLLISGVATGLIFACAPKLLGDISAAKVRGTVIALSFSGIPIGLVVGTIMETYLPMKISSSIYLIHCLLSIIFFFWLKESPYELARKDKIDLARKSIKFYIPTADLDKQINDIKVFIENHQCRNVKEQLKLLTTRSVRKSLFIILVIFALPYASGLMNIISYIEVILIKGKCDVINPADFVIYIRVISAVFTFLFSSLKLIDTLGRKITWIITSVGSSVTMAGLGLHFYLLSLNFNPEKLQWMPMIMLLLYFILDSIGYVIVPNAILSEIFPERAKSIASFVATVWLAILRFASMKAFQPMLDLIGEAYVFWIYAAISMLGIPIALFILPETKGKTFQKIQNDLNNN